MCPYPLPLLPPARPEIHGHRGCRGLLPENTLPAFLRALELGVDVVEMDVVISADREVVVSHEPWLTSLCHDAQGVPISPQDEQTFNLYQMRYADIRRCDCGRIRHPDFPRQHLLPAYKPLLREVIQALELRCQELGRSAVGYSIEIKASSDGDELFHPAPEAFVELVVGVLADEQILPRVTLLSFDKRVLQIVRRRFPQLPLCLLVEDKEPYAKHLSALGFLPEVYGPHHPLVTVAMVADLHAQGVRIVPWTVNAAPDFLRLLSLGVDGLTTDYPDTVLALLNRR